MAKQVKLIPDGYHTITPHLIIRDAQKAIDFYKRAFGAEEIFKMPGPGGKIMHAEIKIGNSIVMLGDESSEMNCLSPQTLNGTPVRMMIYTNDVDTAFK